MDILRQAWRGEPIHIDGKRFQIDGLAVAPRPAQAPKVLMGGMAEPAIARAARLGDGFLSTGGIVTDVYVAALEAAGKDRSEGAIYAGHWGIVAADPEAEAARVAPFALYQTNEYVSWGAFGPPEEVPLFPDGATALEQGLYEVWDGAQAVAELTSMLTAYPEIKDVHFWAQLPGEPIEQGSARIEYLAEEVLPRGTGQHRGVTAMNLGYITAKWAALKPDKLALVDVESGRRLNFGELDERVRRLANALLGAGLEKGDRVGVLARNSIEYFEIYFACARVGLIAQPVNWRLSAGEAARILADGEPSLVVSTREFRDQRDAIRETVSASHWLEFGADSDASYETFLAAGAPQEPPQSAEIGGADPVLILYTGGTTGLSKGALHTHHSLFMGMLNQTVAERIVPSDVYMLTGQMFHIPVALAMNYLAHGCPVVLINFAARLALEVIERERVSAFLGITTMLNWMMADEDFERFDISSLRNIQYGGGPMPATVVKAALDKFPCTLIQGYGQTEGMTMTFLSQEDHHKAVNGDHAERLSSCGREGFVTRVQLVDDEFRPVPKDGSTPGEIVIQSEANMVGYWRRPELNAETFHKGWMRTGDVATWDADGYVFIVDRAKDMIISGGENIYSTQVEAAIHRHPAVLESAVIGVPDDEWGEAVKAVVVLKPGATATAQEIIDTAREHLASYQKPRSVEFVDELPKAPTGKILKRDLRERFWSGRERKL